MFRRRGSAIRSNRHDQDARHSVRFALAGFATSAAAAEYPKPIEGDFVLRDFRFASGETMPELRMHYRTIGKPREGRERHRAQRGADHARHHGQRRAVHPAGVCRRAVRRRATARCDEVLHRDAGWDRPRQVEQAERRAAREVSALRLSRHGRRAVSVAHAKDSASITRGSSWAPRWAECTRGFGARCIRNSWTRCCRSRACRRKSPAAIAPGAAW